MVDVPDLTNLSESNIPPEPYHLDVQSPLFIKLKPMNTRRSSRLSSNASGSEYHDPGSDKSVTMDDPEDNQPKEEESPPPEMTTTQRGRRVVRKIYAESSDNDGEDEGEIPAAADLFDDSKVQKVNKVSNKRRNSAEGDDDDDEDAPRSSGYSLRKRHGRAVDDFIVSDEEDHGNGRYPTRLRKRTNPPPAISQKEKEARERQKQQSQRSQRVTRRTASRATQKAEQDFEPEGNTSSGASADADGSLDDAPGTSSDLEPEPEPEPEPEDEGDGKPYALRQRKEINYAIPPPLEEMAKPPPRQGGNKSGRNGGGGSRAKPRLGWSASGKELGKWMGMPGDDSDSDYPTRTPRKPFGGIAPFGTGAVAGGGMIGDLAPGGTPSNLGKIGDSALADADPLGVNQNVTFDEVGGLDDHIHALKEMTLLPLLYPEVFQRFNVTPPRGVLFHGPPGTGKTLMARALAASCRTGGRQISFFMRKGADCLSKWVGEAERQLRLLFEEARNSQPSIIFFDEIDGLAPVRSSKQDQIHASIVSTLLALMDGMDGRGQVVVIGATNRPDAVDSALRRPGRFDREFYFGLPGLDAREKILSIMTRKWDGWGGSEEEAKSEERQGEARERVKGLAKLTKGYGGADLRALCTEAALNAIQRRYPQVYKSNDRLLLKPETIDVGLRDFMISIKKLVPSSARSSSSAATPLPVQFVPLLDNTLQKVKDVIERVMPVEKKLSALEEAEFEDIGGEEGALEKEMLSQAMQTLRVYRPRVIIHGAVGMGQGYVGAAVLHHLEGYHVQSLELGTLMSDSTRTVEAAIVQLFIEAKRNQPSVIYIPSLIGWCAAVSETSRSTVRAMLDTLAPTDPILLLAVVDGRFSQLPKDVRAWFGPTKDNRVELTMPSASEREAFFEGLMSDIQRPPNRFADGMERRKRILEELPIAPPLEPRKPTAAELALQEENDQRTLTLLKYRLGPILTELKRKFKRFTKRATEEYHFDPTEVGLNGLDTVTTTAIELHTESGPNGTIDITSDPTTQSIAGDHGGPMNGVVMEQQQIMQQYPPLYDMDLERMQTDLFKGRYLTPQDFLDDVGKIVHNADVMSHEDLERLHKAQAMFTAAQVSIQEFDPQLKLECERMAGRERQRREELRKEKAKGKAKDKQANDNAVPAGARRSARNNGLQPEHPITDPVQLERRLKRQRGEEGSSMDSHGSETEMNGFVDVDGERDAKRTRIVDELDDDRDPLDTLASSRPGSEQRPRQIVRFANERIEPMPSLLEVPEMNGYHQYNHQMPMPSHPSLPNYHQQPQFTHSMIVDQSPRRHTGFDPTLLNPAKSPYVQSPNNQSPHIQSHNQYPIPMPFDQRPNNFIPPVASNDPMDPFMSHPLPQPTYHTPYNQYHDQVPAESMVNLLNQTLTPSPPPQMGHPHTPDRHMQIPIPDIPSRLHTPLPAPFPSMRLPSPRPEPEPVAMIVERLPTPPLPEFHVSVVLLSELHHLLKESTAGLTVEQLEQLRATCLGTVWRHRKEWVRDELVKQLLKDVKEFVEEIAEESGDD